MPDVAWSRVDQYFTELLVEPDPAFDAALEASAAGGLPPINVTPSQGKLLYLLVKLLGARSVLEVGTLGGYSAMWMARALTDDGKVVTLEVDAHCAEIAQRNIANAGLSARVELRLGAASATLPQLVREGRGPFDLVFIDADKPGYPEYLSQALALARPGTVIVADNVVRNGAVADPDSADPAVQGVRRFNELVALEPRLDATAVQTVGAKGYDGFLVALVAA